jgi:hypothetical protein
VKIELLGGMQSSNKWLMILLTLSLILTIWLATQSDDAEVSRNEIELTSPTRSEKPAAFEESASNVAGKPDTIIPLVPWHKLERESLQKKINNPFKVHSWVVIPAEKKVKVIPLPPVAPPVPFAYMGKIEDSPKTTQIFLIENGRLYTVSQGEKINQQWRLDAEDVSTLRLTYLPLNLPQVLSKFARPAGQMLASTPTSVPEATP